MCARRRLHVGPLGAASRVSSNALLRRVTSWWVTPEPSAEHEALWELPPPEAKPRLQQSPATSDIVVGTYHLSHQQIMRDPFLSPRNQDDKQSQKTTKMYPYIRIKSTLGPVGRRREQRNKSGHDIPSDRFRPSRGDHGTMTAERPVLAPVSLFPHTDTRAFPHK